MTTLREAAQQVLEAWDGGDIEWFKRAYTVMENLRAALAQQAAQAWVCPESPEHRYAKPGHCEDCGKTLVLAQQAEPVQEPVAWVGDPSTQDYASTVPDPQIEDRLARHGIQACLYPNCVGGQNGTVCHQHCPTPCTDCRGVGYDASGQLCACQQNPSF